MDQDGRQSPQKKCTVIITTFFHTKLLVFSWPRMATCPRGDPLYRPTASLSHFCPHSVGPLCCIDHLAPSPLSVPVLCQARPYLSPMGYLNTFHPTHTFLSPSFRKLEAPAKWFTLMTNQQAAGVKTLFHFPSLKSSLRFKCRQQHSLHIQYQNLHNLIFTSVPSLLYSGKWDSDGEREGHSESHPWMDYHYSGDSKNSKGPDTQAKLTRMSKYDKLKIVRVRQTVFCLGPILPLAPTA